MENKLNKWFDAAKHNPPIISAEEVGAMISNPPAVTIGAKGAKGRFSTLQKSIFMGTLLLIITSWFFWMNGTTQKETNNQNEITNQELIIAEDTPKATDEVADLTKQLVIPTAKIENKEKEERRDIGEKRNEYYYTAPTNAINYKPNNNEFVYLTDEELARLGIKTDGQSFHYSTINGAPDSLLLSAEVELIDNQLTLTYSHKFWPKRDCNGKDMVKPHPAIISSDKWYWLISEKDKIKYGYAEKFFNSVKHLLVPIAVPVEVNTSKEIVNHTYVFWYKPTADFLALLPASVRQELMDKYGIYDSVQYDQQLEAVVAEIQKVSVAMEYSQSELNNIKLRALHLAPNELTKLGFHKSNPQYIYTNYYKAKDNTVKQISIFEFEGKLYFGSPHLPPAKYKLWFSNSKIPLYISDSTVSVVQEYNFQSRGARKGTNIIEERQRLEKELDTLIPIKYLLSDNKTVYYIWFAKTEAFLKALNPTTVSTINETYIGDEMPMGNYPVPGINNFDYRKADGSTEIQLTHEELAALGIITDGNTLKYLNQYDTTRLDNGTKNSPNLHAFAISVKIGKEGGCVSSNTHKVDSVLTSSINNAIPLFISIRDVRETRIRYLLLSNNVPKEFESVLIDTIKNSLIPISVKTIGKGVKYVHDNEVIFWYKNNEAFRSKLPLSFAKELSVNEPEFDEKNLNGIIKGLKNIVASNGEKYRLSNDVKKKNQTKFIVLSPKELKKLNIRFDTKKCIYKTIGYSSDGNAVIISLTVSPDVYLANMMYKESSSLGVYKRRENANPAIYVTDSNLNINSNFKDIPTIEEGDDLLQRDMYKKFAERIDSLVPILVLFDSKEVAKSTDKNPQTHLVFWFPETEALRKVLNEMLFDKSKTGITLKGIHILQLTDSSLNKFGVKRGKAEIEYPMSYNIQSVLSNNGSSTTFNSLTKEEFYQLPVEERGDSTKIMLNNETLQEYYLYTKKNGTPYIVPYLVSDESGKHWYMNSLDEDVVRLDSSDYTFMRTNHISLDDYPKYKEQKQQNTAAIIAKMNYLIPVKVFSTDNSFVVILWYEPKQEVLALLPKDVNNEYESILTGNAPNSCVYFEACQNIRGTISKYMLFPNPMVDALQVDIELGEDRKISIYLTDISGKKIKDIVTNEAQGKGLHSYKTQLNDLSEGMYLVHITTDKGERIVQRLLKKE